MKSTHIERNGRATIGHTPAAGIGGVGGGLRLKRAVTTHVIVGVRGRPSPGRSVRGHASFGIEAPAMSLQRPSRVSNEVAEDIVIVVISRPRWNPPGKRFTGY